MPEPWAPSAIFQVKRVTGADPTAGNEFLMTVPAGKWWLVLCVRVQLVQGLTQTPLPILIYDDGTNEIGGAIGSSAVQSASTTTTYTWAPGHTLLPQTGASPNTRSGGPMPANLLLPAGSRLQSSTIGIGANSDYGVPSALVVEFG